MAKSVDPVELKLHDQLLDTLEGFDSFPIPVGGFVVYSARWRNTSLPRNLRAAAIASAMGLSSLDYARRTYTHDEAPAKPTAAELYLRAYFASRDHMRRTLNSMGEFTEGENYGAFAAAVALQRLDSGFRAAHILYRLGLNIEGDTISRQILEQIAWALAASKLSSLDEIDAVSASYSINQLKKLVPGTGQLYGALSDIAHAGLAQHQEAVELGPDDRGRIVFARGRLAVSAAILVRLADTWVAVCEYTQRDIVTEFRALVSRDDLTLSPNRPFLIESQALLDEIGAHEEKERAS
ncbi:hypothetical protein [Leifsonia poae]|nr:hypothetical protein [Leifsonia poae]